MHLLPLRSLHPPQVPKTRKTHTFLSNQPGSFLGSVSRGFTSPLFHQIFKEIPWGNSRTPIGHKNTETTCPPGKTASPLAVSTRGDSISSLGHRRMADDVWMKKPSWRPAATTSVDRRTRPSCLGARLPSAVLPDLRKGWWGVSWDEGGSDSAGTWPLLSSPRHPSSSQQVPECSLSPLQPGLGHCSDRPLLTALGK